jgi:hypothetical protein
LLGGESTEGGHGDHPLPRQRVLGPVAVLDHEHERPVALVADCEFIRPARFIEQNIAAARHKGRDEPVVADVAISFVTGLDGAKTVWTGANDRSKLLADRAATSP